MAKPILATPPIDDIAVAWAERARRRYAAGDVTGAVEASRKAVAAHARFGSKKVARPQIVSACAKLIEMYEKEQI